MSRNGLHDGRRTADRYDKRRYGHRGVSAVRDQEVERLRRVVEERKSPLEELEEQLVDEPVDMVSRSSDDFTSSSEDDANLPKLPRRRKPTFVGASLQKFIEKRRKPEKPKDRLSPTVLLNQAKTKYIKARKYYEKKFPSKEAKMLAIEEALMVHESSEISPVLKYCLIAGNAIVMVFYGTLLAVCAHVLIERLKNFSSSFWEMHWILLLDPAVVLLTVSLLFFILTFLGFYGALRENASMLRKYKVFLFVLICFVVIILIFLLLYKTVTPLIGIVQYLYPRSLFLKAIDLYDDNDDMRDLIDWLQINFMACGISMSLQGYTDWNNSVYYGCKSDEDNPMRCSVPASCCQGYRDQDGIYRPNENLLCGKDALTKDAPYGINLQGFGQRFSDMITEKFTYIMIGLFSIVSPLYIAVTLSEVLESQIYLQLRKYRRNERDFLRKLRKKQKIVNETFSTSDQVTDDFLPSNQVFDLVVASDSGGEDCNKVIDPKSFNAMHSLGFLNDKRFSELRRTRSPDKATQTSDILKTSTESENTESSEESQETSDRR